MYVSQGTTIKKLSYKNFAQSRFMVLGNFRADPGVLLIWIKVEQGPTVLAVGQDGVGGGGVV